MTPSRRQDHCRAVDSELLHLTSLAHLGFKKMMPNDRGFEMLRFSDEEQALCGTLPSKTGTAIPKSTGLPSTQPAVRH
jgi:hypothetical protein